MFKVFSVIGGAVAVLAVAVGLFLWFGDRGRGPEAVVLVLPEMVKDAARPDDAAVSGQDPASAPRNGDGNSAGDGTAVSGEMARLEAPVDSPTDDLKDLKDLTTAAGEAGAAGSLPSERAGDLAGGNDVNESEPLSQSASVAVGNSGPEGQSGQLSGPVEQPAEKAGPPPRMAPRHGRLAWFEIGVMNRGSNLRENPDVDSPVVAKLPRGARVRVLEAEPVLGYYRVVSGGQEGWVWWLNVDPRDTGDVQG